MCVMWGLGEGGHVCNVGVGGMYGQGLQDGRSLKTCMVGGSGKWACKHVQGGVGGGRVIDGL